MNTEDLPSEEEQFLMAIKLSQIEEEARRKKEEEEEERRKTEKLQEEQEEKELVDLNKISEKIDNLKLKKEIADYLEPYLDDELVKVFKLDQQKSELSLTVDVIENEYKIIIQYPNEGKSGKYIIKTIKSGNKSEKKDSFTSIEKCLEFYVQRAENERDKYLEMVDKLYFLHEQYGGEFTPIGNTPFSAGSQGDDPFIDEDGNIVIDDIDLEGDFEDHSYFIDFDKYLDDQIYMDKKVHSVTKHCVNQDKIVLNFSLDPKVFGLSSYQADAWGIDLTQYIGASITFFTMPGQEEKHPKCEVFQSGNLKTTDVYSNKRKFPLYWTIADRILFGFFKTPWWPFSEIQKKKIDEGLIENLTSYVMNVIKDCSKHCLICGGKMPFEGLRPTVCVKQLCVFRHEQFGLGIDLESEIMKHPDLVDLMITMAYSAATNEHGNFDSFSPFPSGIEVKIKDKFTQVETTYDFLDKSGKHDKKKVGSLIESIPKVTELQKWTKDGKLKEKCGAVSPLCYPFLRWIMASNRCFLKKLTKDKELSQMNCKHQYALLSSTPEKEEKFLAAKKKYGSFYAWHGSALSNWHAIMRNGLKNMSGTAGQRNGAAYGSGVYLAADSGTSFGYMQYTRGWKNSGFGSNNIGCLALCEVANHPMLKGQPNPYYVMEMEEHLFQENQSK
eukprot:gene12442-6194_t